MLCDFKLNPLCKAFANARRCDVTFIIFKLCRNGGLYNFCWIFPRKIHWEKIFNYPAEMCYLNTNHIAYTYHIVEYIA